MKQNYFLYIIAFLLLGWLVREESFAASICRSNITASAPDTRFIDNGNGTVTDTVTGLMWKQCAEGLSGSDCTDGELAEFSWQEALESAEALIFAGHDDWRLPNIKELQSLVEQRCYAPAINARVFRNFNDGFSSFWSSTPAPVINAVQGIEFYYGLTDKIPAFYNGGPGSPMLVVRQGLFDLTVSKNGSGTVTGRGINCGSDCTESYASGVSVSLAASPANGSTFTGWSGACSGTANCTVKMTAAKSVTATFKSLTKSFRINDVSKIEGNAATSNATFAVTLTPASTSSVTVNYATANGSAMAGSDYAAASGTLNFAPEQTSKTFTVKIIGDTVKEANETFVVNLSAPSGGATLFDGKGVGTIINDDGPVLRVNDVSKAEGQSGTTAFLFKVNLSSARPTITTVTYTTANGTAKAGQDYNATTGTLTFVPGQTSRTVSVNVIGDTAKEVNETFMVKLSNPRGASLFDAQGQGIILNDD